jgi:hypothetical protein
MRSAGELRVEAQRLREAAQNITDPATKRALAARALELAQQAEAIANSREHPEIIRANIERYRRMLAADPPTKDQKRIIEAMLQDAEEMLKGVGESS